VLALTEGRLQPYAPGPLVTRRQDKPRVYARNGPAVLAVRVAVLEQGQLYGDDCRALVMTAADSVDIDDQHDFEYAEFLVNRVRN
jgi:CMP-N-acetylneuraminic acid synthetase